MIKVIVCENYDEISKKAAKLVANQINKKPDSILGLATGSTPVGMYKELIKMNKAKELDFSKVSTYNLDEYYPIKRSDEQSYYYFMNENLFSHINIDMKNTHIPDGETDNPKAECEKYEKMLEESGGVDLQILGIGQNGHIGFNEPDVRLNTNTHLTALTEDTKMANSRFFEKPEDVPTSAITMGIATIMKAKKIILLASGENKYDAVSRLLNNDIDTESPATMLKLHPDVTLICDEEAYTKLSLGVDIGGTSIKFGVIDGKKIVYKNEVPTLHTDSEEKLTDYIAEECKKILEKFRIAKIGVGVPGFIRNKRVTSVNLPFKNTELADILSKKINIEVNVENDANCAALGEAYMGEGENYENVIMITIGTGIGGGIIIGGKIYHGRGDAGEIGHLIIERNGKDCPCGQKGCFEQYASATALSEEAKKAALLDENSLLYKFYKENSDVMNGKVFFKALYGGCETAKKVYDEYLGSLACGIKSLINIFSPDIIIISGGISKEGDALLNPLIEKVGSDVPIKISSLQSDAGIVGAAAI